MLNSLLKAYIDIYIDRLDIDISPKGTYRYRYTDI